jgi:DeoR/GlpR family transcriptional regulator of sugar metabolism
MISEIRRKRILEILRRDNNVVTKELSKMFNVSPMTIRRDFKQLEGLGYVKRTYKGAIIEDLGTELSFMDKTLKCREEKERIAKKAV